MLKVISFLASCAFLCGCQTHLRYENAERLMQRDDFNDVAIHAPNWAQDALETINNLELELERR